MYKVMQIYYCTSTDPQNRKQPFAFFYPVKPIRLFFVQSILEKNLPSFSNHEKVKINNVKK